jgi:hypothetical protein
MSMPFLGSYAGQQLDLKSTAANILSSSVEAVGKVHRLLISQRQWFCVFDILKQLFLAFMVVKICSSYGEVNSGRGLLIMLVERIHWKCAICT